MHYSMLAKVKKFVCAGTVDSYPKKIAPPWSEDDLWNGFQKKRVLLTLFQKK